jgi:hypothetical protein
MVSQPDEYRSILKVVASWPADQRATLAHALIEGLQNESIASRPTPTIDQLIGVARGEGPAPTDAQVKQWIDEHRMRKYG